MFEWDIILIARNIVLRQQRGGILNPQWYQRYFESSIDAQRQRHQKSSAICCFSTVADCCVKSCAIWFAKCLFCVATKWLVVDLHLACHVLRVDFLYSRGAMWFSLIGVCEQDQRSNVILLCGSLPGGDLSFWFATCCTWTLCVIKEQCDSPWSVCVND